MKTNKPFDQDKDSKDFSRMLEAGFIGVAIIGMCILILMFGCARTSTKRECQWLCPDKENIPEGCYCLEDLNCLKNCESALSGGG